MKQKDKEFGEHIATATVGKTTIKQYKRGFTIKSRGECITQRIPTMKDTTPVDMARLMTDEVRR